MFNWLAVATISRRWQIFTEVNEQLTDDDLLSFMKSQETALQDSIIPTVFNVLVN